MNRVLRLVHAARSEGRKLLSVFVTAGYPELALTPRLVELFEAAGADFVEIGIPFSDPLADGPTIQRASQVALANGVTLSRVLADVAAIRQHSDLPLLLMGYVNPLLHYGLVEFVGRASEVGADGFIIPDLPPEESTALRGLASSHGMSLVFLAAPNTPEARLRLIDEMTDSFIYCVSVAGVTGERRDFSAETEGFLRRCRATLRNPFLVGFGISGAEQARRLGRLADGVIVGSAVINRLGGNGALEDRVAQAADLVRELRSVLG